MVFSSLFVILVKNPIHSILFLVLVFFNSSGLLLLLDFEFLALIFIIIYVGALAVLFLFVIMMLNIRIFELNGSMFKYVPFMFLTLFALLLICIDIFSILIPSSFSFNSELIYMDWQFYLNAVDNLKAIGPVLFIYDAFLFLLAGIILFLAMIGSIVLVFFEVKTIKKQFIYKQLFRNILIKKIN